MTTVGQVLYSTSSRSPISVSSSSSSSAAVSPRRRGNASPTQSDLKACPSTPLHRRHQHRHHHLGVSDAGQEKRSVVLSSSQHLNTYNDASDVLRSDFAENQSDGGDYALLYVSPTTTRQFVSLSSAVAYLRHSKAQRDVTAAAHRGEQGGKDEDSVETLTNGSWRLGYLVSASRESEDEDKKEKNVFRESSPCWCFTLEPLPAEQLEACRAALERFLPRNDLVNSERSSPSRCSTPRHHHHHHPRNGPDPCRPRRSSLPSSQVLHDVLVTPLYVCRRRAAVVELPCTPQLLPALVEMRHSVAGWPAENIHDALDTFLKIAPSCASVVYALRQRHALRLPLLQLIGSPSDDAEVDGRAERARGPGAALLQDVGVDVYLSLGATSCLSSPPRTVPPRKAGYTDDELVRAGTCTESPMLPLLRAMQRRCRQTPQQTIVFQGCGQTPAQQRQELLQQLCRTSGVETRALADKLMAAVVLLDSLTPPADSNVEKSGAFVASALDVVVAPNAPAPTAAAVHDETPNDQQRGDGTALPTLRLVCGRVQRCRVPFTQNASSASPAWRHRPTVPPLVMMEEEGEEPELDILSFPWMKAHRADQQAAASTKQSNGDFDATDCVSTTSLEACMAALGIPASTQQHLHDLTDGIALMASLRFTTRHATGGTSGEAALLTAESVPACEEAARLLRVSSLALVQTLTTVEVPRSSNARAEQGSNHTARCALNCAGAQQLQALLVASLGGLLVRTLLRSINRAIQGSSGAAGSTTAESLSAPPHSVVSLRACGATASPADAHLRGGGLAEWYNAYAAFHVNAHLCDRLVSAVRDEARCEGVEWEVDTWIDQLRSRSDSFPPTFCTAVVEARTVAERVQYQNVDGAPRRRAASALDRVAAVVHNVLNQMEQDVSFFTRSAVQEILVEDFDEIVHSMERGDGSETPGKRGSDGADVHICWTTTPTSSLFCYSPACTPQQSAASPKPSDDLRDGLLFTFPSGLLPPLRLSLARLADDILATLRMRKLGTTASVVRLLRAVAAAAGDVLEKSDPRPGDEQRPAQAALIEVPSSSTNVALRGTAALFSNPMHVHYAQRNSSSNSSNTGFSFGVVPPGQEAFTLVHTIPVPAALMRDAAMTDTQQYPFLEPVMATPSPLPRQSPFPANSSSSAPIALPYAQPATLDDAVSSYLWRHHPLWLALFFWSRMCHTVMLPVVPFGRDVAVPLLTLTALYPAYTRTPSTTPFSDKGDSLPAESSIPDGLPWRQHGVSRKQNEELLAQVRSLQGEARYRELALLALSTVPLCRCAVLGVSQIFCSAVTASAMVQGRAQLYASAALLLQRNGRGWMARKTVFSAMVHHSAEERTRLVLSDRQQEQQQQQPEKARALTEEQLRLRRHLEQQRDGQWTEATEARRQATTTTVSTLSTTVSDLQRGWTTTLELLESELRRAVAEVNHFETQRRAAENAARQDARTTRRVTEEAWAEVWAEEEKRTVQPPHQRQHQRQPQQQLPRWAASGTSSVLPPAEAAVQARLTEEARLAAIAQRHLTQLRNSAAQDAEAALLTRAVVGYQRRDAQWMQRHVRRQERRLAREAEQRAAMRDAKERAVRERLPAPGGVSNAAVVGAAVASAGAATTTPVRTSHVDTEGVQPLLYSDARGLVFTRPRRAADVSAVQSHGRQRRPSADVDRTRVFSPSEKWRAAAVTIDRTTTPALHSFVGSTMGDDEDGDWEVQRDLMSLWESSRMTT